MKKRIINYVLPKMKTMKKFFAFSILLFAFTVGVFAQASSPALATIIAPIAISNDVVLDFGAIVAGTAVGTVDMATDGTRTASGCTTHTSDNGSPASFIVTGQPNFNYSITLPAGSTTISDGTVANTMTVTNWISDPAAGNNGVLNGTGTQTLAVGARLNVGANQVPWSYSSQNTGGSGAFTVTVNYY